MKWTHHITHVRLFNKKIMCTLLKKLKKKFRPMSTRIINHKINYREIMNILMESSTVCWIPKIYCDCFHE